MPTPHPSEGYLARVAQARGGRPAARLRAQVFSEETHCWLCGKWVDQALHKDHPMSRTVDHVVQLDQGGHPLDRGNCRLAHRRCNTIKANKLRARPRDRGFIAADLDSI